MTCEVCGSETREERSKAPADESYFKWVVEDTEDPDIGIGANEFNFCSIECLLLFAEPSEATA